MSANSTCNHSRLKRAVLLAVRRKRARVLAQGWRCARASDPSWPRSGPPCVRRVAHIRQSERVDGRVNNLRPVFPVTRFHLQCRALLTHFGAPTVPKSYLSLSTWLRCSEFIAAIMLS
ncbi:hypothetical protein CEXT_498671 [Caerostris extrusa]|uniref:Uncharacterized protein n=1 Tax=Caerostris extrusa TaxID=172846 RepID=A0AAV4TK90_CAEEX|nr:hypothetical protein CEXT_498671 [Caerostris extrusa]